MTIKLKAPFPYFGGKSRVAAQVWERFGHVQNYVESFFGSGAVLLGNPAGSCKIETVNDLDGYVCNFWRAVRADPDAVAEHASWPVNELDLHARHRFLIQSKREFAERLRNDPDLYDVKLAGWWVWGLSCWIGDNWSRDAPQDAPQDALPKMAWPPRFVSIRRPRRWTRKRIDGRDSVASID